VATENEPRRRFDMTLKETSEKMKTGNYHKKNEFR